VVVVSSVFFSFPLPFVPFFGRGLYLYISQFADTSCRPPLL
jgi:hypothetical protein